MPIRSALPGDAGALAKVAALTFPLACPPSTTEAAKATFIATVLSEAAFTGYLADDARLLVVADPGGGAPLDGYTMVVLGAPTDPDVVAATRIRPIAELSKCYVRPGLHGRGTAAALLERSTALAAERGAAGMWLGTNAANARAIRFYEKHGFVRVGAKRFKLGDGYEDDLVLERAL